MEEYAMKKLSILALLLAALAASSAGAQGPAVHVQYAQPVCGYPAHWVWRGYWSCEYRAPVYYPQFYYSYPYRHHGGHGVRGHSGGHHGGHR
jgi:hypothetical protein